MPAVPEQETSPSRQRTLFMWIYALAAAGAIAQYAVTLGTVLLGCVLLWVCNMMLKRQEKMAEGTAYESHAIWIRRTLHIGGYYLLPAAVLIMFYIIYKDTHIAALQQEIVRNHIISVGGMENLLNGYLRQYGGRINLITIICITPPILWWIWRCWTGLCRVHKSEPIDSPRAFL